MVGKARVNVKVCGRRPMMAARRTPGVGVGKPLQLRTLRAKWQFKAVEKNYHAALRKSGQTAPVLGLIPLLDVLVHRAPQAESVSIFPSIHLPRFLASFRGRSPPAGRAVFAKHVVAPCAIDLTMFQSATQYEPNVHGLIGGKTHPDYHRMASNR